MNKKGNNRSVLRTKALLKQGLTELMLSKPPSKITVSELTEYVNLNRGTFYLHYRDIFDLLDQMENESTQELLDILSTHRAEEVQGKPFYLIQDVFRFLKENADFCRAVLSDSRHDPYISKIKNLVKEKVFTDWEHLFAGKNKELCDIFFSYVLSGVIGILEHWLFNGTVQSVDEIAALTEQFVLRGMDALS